MSEPSISIIRVYQYGVRVELGKGLLQAGKGWLRVGLVDAEAIGVWEGEAD